MPAPKRLLCILRETGSSAPVLPTPEAGQEDKNQRLLVPYSCAKTPPARKQSTRRQTGQQALAARDRRGHCVATPSNTLKNLDDLCGKLQPGCLHSPQRDLPKPKHALQRPRWHPAAPARRRKDWYRDIPLH